MGEKFGECFVVGRPSPTPRSRTCGAVLAGRRAAQPAIPNVGPDRQQGSSRWQTDRRSRWQAARRRSRSLLPVCRLPFQPSPTSAVQSLAVAAVPEPSGGSLQVARALCVAGDCVGGAIACRWFGRVHCRARCGRGFGRFHCRGRRGGGVRGWERGIGGRVPAAVRALAPALWGLSLVPPSVGAEPPGRSWINHRHPLGASEPVVPAPRVRGPSVL